MVSGTIVLANPIEIVPIKTKVFYTGRCLVLTILIPQEAVSVKVLESVHYREVSLITL